MSHELESVAEQCCNGGDASTLKAWDFVFLYPSLDNGGKLGRESRDNAEMSAIKLREGGNNKNTVWISSEGTEEATHMAQTSNGSWSMFTTQVTSTTRVSGTRSLFIYLPNAWHGFTIFTPCFPRGTCLVRVGLGLDHMTRRWEITA